MQQKQKEVTVPVPHVCGASEKILIIKKNSNNVAVV